MVVNEELKFFVRIQKQIFLGGIGGRVGGGRGQGRHECRSEFFVNLI